jgi:hypothetical protein
MYGGDNIKKSQQEGTTKKNILDCVSILSKKVHIEQEFIGYPIGVKFDSDM